VTSRRPNTEPQRLSKTSSAAGELLREVLREAPSAPQDVAWRKLQTRLANRDAAPGLGWLFALTAAGVALVVVLLFAPSRSALKVSADPALVARVPETSSSSAPPALVTAPSLSAEVVARAAPVASSRAPVSSPRAGERSASGALESCASLAHSGDYAGAVTCYQHLSEGSTLSAEFALYEKARLEARALGDEGRALGTLNTLRKRFPHGNLEVETALSRIEILAHLGQVDTALAAIDQALAGRARAERGADLLSLEAELLQRRGDCAGFLSARKAALAAGAKADRLPIAPACSQVDSAGEGTLPK
jgi:tetratricopeptide (TPR) repeat protein